MRICFTNVCVRIAIRIAITAHFAFETRASFEFIVRYMKGLMSFDPRSAVVLASYDEIFFSCHLGRTETVSCLPRCLCKPFGT